ncbi:uncharacterized protein LOC118109988 [Hippoglossus stenolepis]|uniref:uncharacterized protein LOC118109988 n=1 Tax=Hippoglossus stenolepis TaxID=195615 RepID=UPI001FAEE257|nr:uncharacterized protein LOC118109988 [Hippoglossus stenolepis]
MPHLSPDRLLDNIHSQLIMDNLELLSSIFSLCKTIYGMVGNMKTNKERCQRVTQRVKALEDVVLLIKQRGPGQMSSAVVKALNELWITLISTNELIKKYSQTKAFLNFVKSKSHEEQFYKMNESLTDNFQVLSGVLQVENGNMLCKVYDCVSGMQHNEELPLTSPTALMPRPMHTAPMPTALMPTALMPRPMPIAPMPTHDSPDAYSTDASPHAYSPHAYSPHAYSPHAYSPDAYSTDASPHAYSPHAYTAPMPTAPMHTAPMPTALMPMPRPHAYSPHASYLASS